MSRNIHPISPFVTYCQKVIPLAFDESLSYYEALCALVHYLKHEVTPAVNENADAVTELQNYVANYFDNLDVQEEINNKLDAMAEDGTLQEIISVYINTNATLCFNSVSEMKSASNLIDGSFAQTLGYHTKNDGGEGLYKIRTVTNDDMEDDGSIIPLDNESLVAELIIKESTVNIKQFGAKGDDLTDDTTRIQECITFALNNGYSVFIPSGVFRISKVSINGTINMYGTGEESVIKSIDNNTNDSMIFIENNGVKNSEIHHFKIYGNRDNVITSVDGIRLYITQSLDYYMNIHDLHIEAIKGNGINLTTASNEGYKEMRIDNIESNSITKSGLYLKRMTDSIVTRCVSSGCGEYGIYTSDGGSNKFTNCKAFWCGGGDGTTPEDPERVPSNAFSQTSDTTPQSGKRYYTRSGTDTENDYYEFTLYTGSSFSSGTTYYEMSTFYSKRYAGFNINGTANIVTGCESQDNFGDGFAVSGSENKFSNVSCDNNGLITISGTPVSYASQNKTQLYYGIYVSGWQFYADSCCFLNHLNGSIGKSQRGSVYIKGGGYTTVNGTQSNQVVDTITIQKVSDPLTLSSKLNNKDWVYNLPMKYILFNGGFELDDTNNNYFYYKNNTLYYKLTLKKTGGGSILNGTTAVKLFNFQAGVRPKKRLTSVAYLTNNSGYLVEGICTKFIETWGDVNVRYKDNSLDGITQVIVEGEYMVN